MRWLLALVLLAAALGIGTALAPIPGVEPEAAPASASESDLARPALRRTASPPALPAAPVRHRALVGQVRAAEPVPSQAPSVAAIDDELRATEQALASSQWISQPPADAVPFSPSREARDAAADRASAAALGCREAASACLSSADCCPGLACAGGVAAYGTPGRCEAAR